MSACGVAPTGTPQAAGPLATRGTAPAGFHDLRNKPISLNTLLGKPVVLSFLEPGHSDSEAQLPILIRLADAYAGDGVAFVLAGENANQSALRAYVITHDLAFPVWEDRAASEWRRRDYNQVPAHEFRDAVGHPHAAHDGFMSRGEMTAAIEALLAGRGPKAF